MKKLTALVAAIAFSFATLPYSVSAQTSELPSNVIMVTMPDSVIPSAYSEPVKVEGLSYNFAPVFMIYPDSKVNAKQAAKLVDELGIAKVDKLVLTAVYVVNPVGNKYDAAADFEVFKTLFSRNAADGNIKVIGIGEGATFVNQVIAPQADFCIAGILSIDGKAYKFPKKAEKHAGVPAYIAGKNAAKAADAYIKMADAKYDKDGYYNADENLLKVAVDEEPAKDLADIFSKAWTSVLSRNYRFNNVGHTFYDPTEYGQYGTYELEPYANWEALNITRLERTLVPNSLRPEDLYLWYEYWPNELMKDAKPKSVPIMVLLHGNRNDPRAQAETSGYLQVAGEERFFIVEMEWQGSHKFIAMQHDGIESLLDRLCREYPQLDPSRIYASGLSAGSMTAASLGITKSHVFAAVGGNNGGTYSDALFAQASQKSGAMTAYCSIAGTADFVVGVVGPDTYQRNGISRSWQLYQKMNGLPVWETLDFNVDPVFGMKLAERETIHFNKGDGIDVETGLIYKGSIPVMKLVAVVNYGHGNFQPCARIAWDFFKHFSRNRQTGELIYEP